MSDMAFSGTGAGATRGGTRSTAARAGGEARPARAAAPASVRGAGKNAAPGPEIQENQHVARRSVVQGVVGMSSVCRPNVVGMSSECRRNVVSLSCFRLPGVIPGSSRGRREAAAGSTGTRRRIRAGSAGDRRGIVEASPLRPCRPAPRRRCLPRAASGPAAGPASRRRGGVR